MRRAAFALRLVPILWLAALVAAPLLVVVKLSLSEAALAQPPYRPLFAWDAGPAGWLASARALTLDNYRTLLAEPAYLDAALGSLAMAAVATALLLLIGFPMALAISRQQGRLRLALVAAVTLPFWTSFLVRIYAWIVILKPEGLLNTALLGLGLVRHPVAILNTDGAVLLGLVYAYLPFAILPLLASLDRVTPEIEEAAADLGAGRLSRFWTITLPLARPGIAAAILLTAMPICGEFVVPDLLGGSQTQMIGRTLWTEFFANRDWPLASAIALVLLLALAIPAALLREGVAVPGEGRA